MPQDGYGAFLRLLCRGRRRFTLGLPDAPVAGGPGEMASTAAVRSSPSGWPGHREHVGHFRRRGSPFPRLERLVAVFAGHHAANSPSSQAASVPRSSARRIPGSSVYAPLLQFFDFHLILLIRFSSVAQRTMTFSTRVSTTMRLNSRSARVWRSLCATGCTTFPTRGCCRRSAPIRCEQAFS